MIAGHAMVAWPATYGDSGVETFICGENGIVYQKDFGANTTALGAAMTAYNPDSTWKVVEEGRHQKRASSFGPSTWSKIVAV